MAIYESRVEFHAIVPQEKSETLLVKQEDGW